MSKTLQRPMFKMGGTTNTGIMDGFEDDRIKRAHGGAHPTTEEKIAAIDTQTSDILSGLEARAAVPEYDPTFDQGLALAKAGFQLASAPGGRPILQTIGEVAGESLDDFAAIGTKRSEAAKEQREAGLSVDLAKLDVLQEDKKTLAGLLDEDEFQRALGAISSFEDIITSDDASFAEKQSAFNSLNFTLDKYVGQDIDILDRQTAESDALEELTAAGKTKETDPALYNRLVAQKLRAKILPGYNLSTYYDQLKAAAAKEGIPFAEGGRVEAQEGTFVAPTEQGQMPKGSMGLTFQELRARLPQEVTDEVVKLIATSEEALLDFANLETQEDIVLFNQKYQADLQLPAQVA